MENTKPMMPLINSPETIEGHISRITFHNEENGFCVLRVKVSGSKGPKTKDGLVTMLGSCIRVSSGECFEAKGFWHNDKQYGLQFKADTITLLPPTTLEGMEKYLASGLIKGIGPVYAKKMIKKFSNKVFDIIENHPQRLLEIDGIGQSKVEKIKAGWLEHTAIRDLMLFLHSYGISTTKAARIYKMYGDESIAVILSNPYKLANDIHGVGFLGADQMAEKIGIEKSSMIRVRAGVSYVLLEAMGNGHCGLPVVGLITQGQKLLEVEDLIIEDALEKEVAALIVIKDKIDDEDFVFLAGLYHSEKYCAEQLLNLAKQQCPWPKIENNEIDKVLDESKITLSDTQKNAIVRALSSSILAITGGPGVGKTTILRCLLKILKAAGVRFLLAAPTGRAAKRMREATGFEAKTIHRLLEVNGHGGGYNKNSERPLDVDLLVIDEASMVDVPLFTALLKALPKKAALFLVGDKDQLPSVGAGQVLGDILSSNAIPTVHLTEVFRQGNHSQIIEAAHNINKGQIPNLKSDKNSDFFFLESEDAEAGLVQIIELVKERIPNNMGFSPISDIQVLCPMNHGLVGTRALNIELQKALNPPSELSLMKYGATYSVGDKVMQTTNNYDKNVYNGDIGVILSIDKVENEVTIIFDEREIVYDESELDEIALAYAMTIHKSQGSEYKVVIIPVFTAHYAMLQRNLIYTGVTRGKELVILVGQKKALYMAVKRGDASKRWTILGQILAVSDVDIA